MKDLCPGSGDRVPEDGTVYCLCGRVWCGALSPDRRRDAAVDRVPEHDQDGHLVDVRRLGKRIDAAHEAAVRRRESRASMPSCAHEPVRAFVGGWRGQ